MTRVIVFDLDDTLYPEQDFQHSGFRIVADWLFEHRGIEGFYGVASSLFGQGVRRKIFDLALEKMGISFDASLIRELVQVFRDHEPAIQLFPDAEWAIQWCRERGYKTGLITDGYLHVQENKVKVLKLRAKLDLVVITDKFGRKFWKPHPLAYQMVMERFGRLPAEYVYVGDNPSKDFVAAKNLGWHTVQVRHENGEHRDLKVDPVHDAEFIVPTLFDLADLERKF